MFRKPKRKPNKTSSLRNKAKEDEDDDNTSQLDQNNNQSSPVGFKKKKKKFRKRSYSDSSDSDGNNGEHSTSTTATAAAATANTAQLLHEIKVEKQQSKKRRNQHTSNSSSSNTTIMHQFEASQNTVTQKDLATREAVFHPSASASASTVNKSEQEQQIEDVNGVKLYKGEIKERSKFLAGPIKAPTFIRTTTRFDYEPNICKDYKDTGFCGFGDTCIYLHDRTNMKQGWQIEQEYEDKKKKEQMKKEKEIELFCQQVSSQYENTATNIADTANNTDRESGASSTDGIPFACHICRNAFNQPIITSCNHYFCQSCILSHMKQNNNDTMCPLCGKDTNGVFNYPTKLHNKKKKLVGSNGTWKEFFNAMQSKLQQQMSSDV
mmetsp:Transcript_3666/g.4190  ORF Transcript_3666/g.4190 Transcript_3666/m.4190 type:complete len:379 (-) Transcript_3666:87-1223(-)